MLTFTLSIAVDLSRGSTHRLFGKFEQIASAYKGTKIVIFLDYDGTHLPMIADPDATYMSDAVRTRPSSEKTSKLSCPAALENSLRVFGEAAAKRGNGSSV